MENTVKDKIAKILSLSEQFLQLSGNNENVIDVLNKLTEEELEEIKTKLSNNPNKEKINKIRLLVVDYLIENKKIDTNKIESIKADVNKMYDTEILRAWRSYFKLFIPFLYREKVINELKEIAIKIIDSLELTNLVKYKVVDFDGPTNFGDDISWIAIYNKKQPSQRVCWQLFIGFKGETISYGLLRNLDKSPDRDAKLKNINLDTFDYNQMIDFLTKSKKIIVDDVFFKRYWKFSPGENACCWEEMKHAGIAAIGFGNHDYSLAEDVQDIKELAPEIRVESPGMLFKFINASVGDVIYAFQGINTVIGYGEIINTAQYSENSLVSEKDYHNYLGVKWVEFESPLVLNKGTKSSTFLDISNRDDIHSEIEKYMSKNKDADKMKVEQDNPSNKSTSLNQILYGPPGTGKTYNTVTEALKVLVEIIVDEEEYRDGDRYSKDKRRFDALKAKGHIEFITFHQSFSYEDFVEGIRAETNDGGISYSVKDGIFKKIAIEALFSKLDLSGDKLDEVWKKVIDTNNVIVNKKITPETKFDPKDSEHKKLILAIHKRSDFIEGKGEPYVLIIDEINRGNTSRIFGELITLIESTKRAGSDEAMDAVLPYSQETFTVPDNLYIIGTMNTADRSLALIDTALRRRFDFIEMMPDVTLIEDKKSRKPIKIEGVDIQEMLKTINDRIEVLYDREHTIGHAFFMKLTDDSTITDLASVFKRNILPLLEEYFFEDWKKICQVLGKSGIYEVKSFTESGLSTGNNYSRKEELLAIPGTYINIYKDTDSAQRDSTGSS
jgi:hypothetical protein